MPNKTVHGLGSFTTILNLTEASTGLGNLATTYGTHTATMDTHNATAAVFYLNVASGGTVTSGEMKVSATVDGTNFFVIPPTGFKAGAVTAFNEVSKAAGSTFRYQVDLTPEITQLKVDVKVTGATNAVDAVVVKVGLDGMRAPFVSVS